MRQSSIVVTLLFALACTPGTAPSDGRVDAALMGTWQIEGGGMGGSLSGITCAGSDGREINAF